MLTVYRVAVMSTEAASGNTNPPYDHNPMSNRVMSAISGHRAAVAKAAPTSG